MEKNYEIVAREAERTYKIIKQLNKTLSSCKTRAEKDEVAQAIAAEKEEWYRRVINHLGSRPRGFEK